jgi:hypothetical protein
LSHDVFSSLLLVGGILPANPIVLPVLSVPPGPTVGIARFRWSNALAKIEETRIADSVCAKVGNLHREEIESLLVFPEMQHPGVEYASHSVCSGCGNGKTCPVVRGEGQAGILQHYESDLISPLSRLLDRAIKDRLGISCGLLFDGPA